MKCVNTGESRLFCPKCDEFNVNVFFDAEPDSCKICVVDWLTGQQLSNHETTCEVFESAPYPDKPATQNNENRFFLYHEIAKVLGVNGVNKRAKLPWCVNRRIRELYPDPEGTPTKVGFKRARG